MALCWEKYTTPPWPRAVLRAARNDTTLSLLLRIGRASSRAEFNIFRQAQGPQELAVAVVELDGSVLETPDGTQVFGAVGNCQALAAVDEQRVRNVENFRRSQLKENSSHELLDFLLGHSCNLSSGKNGHRAMAEDYTENARGREGRSAVASIAQLRER